MRITGGAFLAAIALTGPARADCLEDGESVTLTGTLAPVARGWQVEADSPHCLVIPAHAVRADGTARWYVLPGTHRVFAVAGDGLSAGPAVLTGVLAARLRADGRLDDPPFVLILE